MDFLHKFLSILELTIQYCAELNTVPRAEAKGNSMIIFNKQVFHLLCNSALD